VRLIGLTPVSKCVAEFAAEFGEGMCTMVHCVYNESLTVVSTPVNGVQIQRQEADLHAQRVCGDGLEEASICKSLNGSLENNRIYKVSQSKSGI
jgi:hypothetical protein